MYFFEEQSKRFSIYVHSFKGSQKGEMLWYSILSICLITWIVFHLPGI